MFYIFPVSDSIKEIKSTDVNTKIQGRLDKHLSYFIVFFILFFSFQFPKKLYCGPGIVNDCRAQAVDGRQDLDKLSGFSSILVGALHTHKWCEHGAWGEILARKLMTIQN